MKVYMVSDGDYSDYSIQGVFSTEEKAQKFLSHFMYDRIEVRNIDPDVPECQGDRYRLEFNIATGERAIDRVTNDGQKCDWEPWLSSGQYGDVNRVPLSCGCYYFAKDLNTAYKIAGDKIMALQAGSTFITDRVRARECDMLGVGRPSAESYDVWYACTWRVDGKVAKLVSKVKE
jgi:hypothetical protein